MLGSDDVMLCQKELKEINRHEVALADRRRGDVNSGLRM